MKALSVRQPWASLIAAGIKSIELRSWTTKYRGPLVIVAGAGIWRGTDYPIGPRGVAMCTVDLVDVRLANEADTDAACWPLSGYKFAWLLRAVRGVPAIPIKGRLGLFSLPTEAAAIIGEQSQTRPT